LTATLKGLEPGVTYEIRAISLHKGVPNESVSQFHTTRGGSEGKLCGFLDEFTVNLIKNMVATRF